MLIVSDLWTPQTIVFYSCILCSDSSTDWCQIFLRQQMAFGLCSLLVLWCALHWSCNEPTMNEDRHNISRRVGSIWKCLVEIPPPLSLSEGNPLTSCLQPCLKHMPPKIWIFQILCLWNRNLLHQKNPLILLQEQLFLDLAFKVTCFPSCAF